MSEPGRDQEPDRAPEPAGPSRRRAILKLAGLVGLVGAGYAVLQTTPAGDYLTREGVAEAISWLRGNPWAPVVFVAAYATATALAVPGTVLTLAGGAVFGVFWGSIFNLIAANLGANAAFVLARFLGRDGVRRLAGADSAALRKLDEAVERQGFTGLLVLRLIPLVPFNVLNFGAALTALRWPVYAGATLIGILPGTVVYTFFADALLQGSQEASREALVRVLIAGALLAGLAVLPAILKRFGARLPAVALLAAAPWAGAEAAELRWTGNGPTPVAGTSVRVAAASSAAAQAATPVRPIQRAGDSLPAHEPFTVVLYEVVRDGEVDYARLAARPDGLFAYLVALGAASSSALATASHDDRLAFWINAYNACMLKRVVERYPIERAGGLRGLRNRLAGRPANSVWQIEDVFTQAHCLVAGALRSQDEIEHEIIRPMGDPRIHFAVNCAARSCPALMPWAYTGEGLDGQLDGRVRNFLVDESHFRIVAAGAGRELRVNRVLDWFQEDFGGHEGVRSFLAGYAVGAALEALEDGEARLGFLPYDWTLNDIPR